MWSCCQLWYLKPEKSGIASLKEKKFGWYKELKSIIGKIINQRVKDIGKYVLVCDLRNASNPLYSCNEKCWNHQYWNGDSGVFNIYIFILNSKLNNTILPYKTEKYFSIFPINLSSWLLVTSK